MQMFDFEVTVRCPVLMTNSVRVYKAYDEADATEQAQSAYPHGKVLGVKKKENQDAAS